MPVDNVPSSSVNGFVSIETDIQAMEEFAATLANEVQNGYEPHLQQVVTAMMTELPLATPNFPELQSFLKVHHEAQQQTFSNTFNFRDGTHHFATVAKSISEEYGSSDAYAKARVGDVNAAFLAASNPLTGDNGSKADH